MIFYMINWNMGPGISGFEWVLIIIGIFLDIPSYGKSYGNRQRLKRV